MRLIKLIAPAAMIAALALLAPHANAQTMGEYATHGGSRERRRSRWAPASAASARATSAAGRGPGAPAHWAPVLMKGPGPHRLRPGAGADFDSRAGSMAGASASDSRWPTASHLDGDGSDRFSDSSNRFQDQDRFSEQCASDRFPSVVFTTRSQADTTSESSGLDTATASGMTTATIRTDAAPGRLTLRRGIAPRALLARSRPYVVDLIGRFERGRTFRKSHPRQLAPREDVDVGRDCVGIVQRPCADEQRLAAGRDLRSGSIGRCRSCRRRTPRDPCRCRP